jgi:hypothetical protein
VMRFRQIFFADLHNSPGMRACGALDQGRMPPQSRAARMAGCRPSAYASVNAPVIAFAE